MRRLLRICAVSHKGLVRGRNEDNIYLNGRFFSPWEMNEPFVTEPVMENRGVWALCDGMGGTQKGELAAYIALSVLAMHHDALLRAKNPAALGQAVEACVRHINDELCRQMADRKIRMGTTLALVVVWDGRIYPFNIGDSRIYALEKDILYQISEEHTVAHLKSQLPVPAAEVADSHKLTRHLGVSAKEVVVSSYEAPPVAPRPGLIFLLCSDGLSDMVSDRVIGDVLRSSLSVKEKNEQLVSLALKAGGKDNVSCVLLEVFPKNRALLSLARAASKISGIFAR